MRKVGFIVRFVLSFFEKQRPNNLCNLSVIMFRFPLLQSDTDVNYRMSIIFSDPYASNYKLSSHFIRLLTFSFLSNHANYTTFPFFNQAFSSASHNNPINRPTEVSPV